MVCGEAAAHQRAGAGGVFCSLTRHPRAVHAAGSVARGSGLAASTRIRPLRAALPRPLPVCLPNLRLQGPLPSRRGLWGGVASRQGLRSERHARRAAADGHRRSRAAALLPPRLLHRAHPLAHHGPPPLRGELGARRPRRRLPLGADRRPLLQRATPLAPAAAVRPLAPLRARPLPRRPRRRLARPAHSPRGGRVGGGDRGALGGNALQLVQRRGRSQQRPVRAPTMG
mmetsp:Transcript_31320/g.103669  ORF Transcript_31320/g.103669 Transcript_31320/m.103669 type:complete len:228 (-) Transcript_31320:123-806(-)